MINNFIIEKNVNVKGTDNGNCHSFEINIKRVSVEYLSEEK